MKPFQWKDLDDLFKIEPDFKRQVVRFMRSKDFNHFNILSQLLQICIDKKDKRNTKYIFNRFIDHLQMKSTDPTTLYISEIIGDILSMITILTQDMKLYLTQIEFERYLTDILKSKIYDRETITVYIEYLISIEKGIRIKYIKKMNNLIKGDLLDYFLYNIIKN